MADFSMDDYIDVAQRIQDFKDTHRDGSLQTLGWEIVTARGQAFNKKGEPIGEVERTFVVYRAAAFRTPDDERPGHGIAWEPFPGETNYTRNSELMNAETAAWGRAIIALGLTANRKLASRQEVRARVEEAEQRATASADKSEGAKPAKKPPIPKRTEAEVTELRELAQAAGWDWKTIALQLVAVDALKGTPEPTKTDVGTAIVRLTPEQFATVKAALEDEVARKVATDAA